jgi:hypothetical protein
MEKERDIFIRIPEEEHYDRLSDVIIRKMILAGLTQLLQSNKSKWLTHKEAAAYIMKTPAALYKLSSEKQIQYSKRGKQNYYRQEDLDVYMEAGLIKTKMEIISETKLSSKRNYNTLKK